MLVMCEEGIKGAREQWIEGRKRPKSVRGLKDQRMNRPSVNLGIKLQLCVSR